MAVIFGSETASTKPRYTQVYQATHEGGLRLPFMNRSFISFSYGGKNIEDFNVIAYTNGDRLERDGYASFEDLTTQSEVIDGQFYWGTHYHTNSITFDLATDDMDEMHLDQFKHWFKAGVSRELVLAEHPNRAIHARVAQPPQLHLLPFESKRQIELNGATYTTSTTSYKGEITLELTMDEPFWYSIQNVLGTETARVGSFNDAWIDANHKEVHLRDGNKDLLKIVMEDRIPIGSTVSISVFFGGDIFAHVMFALNSYTAQGLDQTQYQRYVNNTSIGKDGLYNTSLTIGGIQYNYWYGATAQSNDGKTGSGIVAGTTYSDIDDGNKGITLAPDGQALNMIDDIAYLYYPGTAPTPVTLKFTMSPRMTDSHITSPASKEYPDTQTGNPYNTITLTANNKHEFKFSLPLIYSSYNSAVDIVNDTSLNEVEKKEKIRDEIRHPYVRKWAIKCIENGDVQMSDFFQDKPAEYEFNAETGVAIGTFYINDENVKTTTENVGNMIKGSYIILDERNRLNDELRVVGWVDQSNDKYADDNYTYKITQDTQGNLFNLQFIFKNRYL